MRAIAFLLLGLLAITGACPACATMAAPARPVMTDMGAACPPADHRGGDHGCAAAACLGCALPSARTAFPVPPLVPRAAPIARRPDAPLDDLAPRAAIPPPRAIA